MSEADGFKLIIEDDEGRRSVVPVDLGEVSIGRLDGNTIRLNERNVSRRHARLFKDAVNVVAEDLDSYNGVFINGDRIKGRQEVRDGDLIRIGDFQLELRGEGLQTHTEETTQRTQMPYIEATQPDIRLSQPDSAPALSSPVAADEEIQPREEPTALIRMSHLEDVEASRLKAAIAGQKAKLVCVSTQFAGNEFEVTKTEMVIGRTDDNDIAIDHRSVSRHHAKIITAGQSVKVVDLKSANGTLVNGEEYAQADLKTGDLVELGHVKFRFVPAGQNYSFTAEEQAAINGSPIAPAAVEVGHATTPPPTMAYAEPTMAGVLKANQFLVLAIAGLAAAIVIMVLWLARGRDETVVAATDPLVEAVPAPVAGAPPPSNDADRQYSQAAMAFQQREWAKAATLARAALTYEPTHVKAQEIVQQAESEARAQSSYDFGVAAINDNQWSQAWNNLQEIPATSTYATQARALMDQVRGALVTEKIQEGDRALEAGDWTRVDGLADEIAGLDPARPEIAQLRASAEEGRKRKPEKATPRKTPRTTPKQPKQPKPPPPAPPPVTADAKTLNAEGIAALKAGQFQKAIDKFGACVKANKNYACGVCYRAMGITYARAGNGPKAYRYYKQYLKVCPTAKDAADVEALLKQYENAR